MGTSGVLRTFLLLDIVALALLALFYLRQRRMSRVAFLAWGMVAVFVPVLGPFLVISRRPGAWDPSFSLALEFQRLGSWVQRLLPSASQGAKPSRLERVRARRQRKRR